MILDSTEPTRFDGRMREELLEWTSQILKNGITSRRKRGEKDFTRVVIRNFQPLLLYSTRATRSRRIVLPGVKLYAI